jgi:uncharacterized protein
VPGLPEYRLFINELEAEAGRIEASIGAAGRPGVPCRPGCAECCLPLTVFPIEAAAILDGRDLLAVEPADQAGAGQACAFLRPDRSCAIYPARPFLCRTRGIPVLHLNEDGEWERGSCVRRGFGALAGAGPGLRLEEWNARLFRLNLAYCAERGIPPGRTRLSTLSCPQAGRVVPA